MFTIIRTKKLKKLEANKKQAHQYIDTLCLENKRFWQKLSDLGYSWGEIMEVQSPVEESNVIKFRTR